MDSSSKDNEFYRIARTQRLIALCSTVPGYWFTVPAEIFPAMLRSTCHGISAACGKLGVGEIVGVFGQRQMQGSTLQVLG
ncbi:hypothetical protein Dsin_024875 [Dipteronia sinensis]|uniref:Uncharacterized protein n=1 Tax=Dipteronia sinensis TaxID=43782 RepID=A0AAD9ZUJ9_9ROSI|nr:hypothetical protein Dsin_024875 [Dipteronia sinensis]